MVEAIREHLGDLEDYYLAEQRMAEFRAGAGGIVSLEALVSDLGVAAKEFSALDKPIRQRIAKFLADQGSRIFSQTLMIRAPSVRRYAGLNSVPIGNTGLAIGALSLPLRMKRSAF
jgi:hypothetical protein